MIDISKVKMGLECCTNGENNTPKCEKCPYADEQGTCEKLDELHRDALELLKAQQKTPVVFKQYDGSIESECGNCGLYLDKTYSVCPKCGKELNWNA